MTVYYADEVAGLDTVPSTKSNGAVHNARLRRFRATVQYDGQGTSDTVVLARVPAGYAFAFGMLTASATAGASATLAIGVSGATGKYRAAATHTTTAPTLFGVAAATDNAPLTAEEEIFLTIAVAALPTSADFVVVDLYFSAP